MAETEQPKNDSNAQPSPLTWKDLLEFSGKQADSNRNVIDYWFKLAGTLLGIVLAFIGIVVTIIGVKTIADVKAIAETAARDAAKAKVEEVLKQPDVQKLVRETASDLFEKGAFRKEIEGKVGEIVSSEVSSPSFHRLISDAVKGELTTRTAARVLTDAQARTIADSLRSPPEGQVLIRTGTLPEQQGYARKFLSAIKLSPSWRDHVSYGEPGTWAGLTANTNLLLEGIVIVVNDLAHPPDSARSLDKALKNAGIADVRIGTCGCGDPPKPQDVWLYIGEKRY